MISEATGKGKTTVRYHLGKHGLRTKNYGRTWTDDQLIRAVSESTSMTQVIPKLGLSETGAGNRRTIRNRIDKLGLDTSHWRGQDWSKGVRNPKKTLDEILVEGSTYSTHNLRKRLLQEGLKDSQCESCGLREWLGSPIPLELDHINGVPDDHRIDNLRVLCPNCHAMTPTWRGRKNKSRTYQK